MQELERFPSDNELAAARYQGRYVALVASLLAPHRDEIITVLKKQ